MSEARTGKKLEIIYVITQLELGGAQKVCLELFQHFAKTAHSTLLCGERGILNESALGYGPVVFIRQLKNTLSPRFFGQDVMAFFKILAQIRSKLRDNPDLIVHTHSSKAGILGRIAARVAGCKNIVHTVHGFGFNGEQSFCKFWFIWFIEFFINHFFTKQLVFVSLRDMAYAQQKMKVPSAKCRLINACAAHFPEEETFERSAHTKKIIKVGTVSCFKPQKNLSDLLEVFASLEQRVSAKNSGVELQLELVGDGPQRQSLERRIAELGLAHKVFLRGWRSDLKDFYREIDIFALSSLWEGLPCAAVEARFFKVPVVAYNVGGLQEVIFNGSNGFLVMPKDRNNLLNKLEILVVNAGFRRKLGGFLQDLEPFRPSAMLKAHEKLYQSLIL